MMTVHIDETTAEILEAQAKALGLTLPDYLRRIAGNGSHVADAASDMPHDQWSARLRAWAAGFPTLPRVADDTRESIYAGRGE